ncbi:MAG TPA: aldose epimerase family protein [Candidatus Didemnitutus sp.]|nr:aldose epimerase family protein [Candidatus Didemnitutus sp.]
MNSIEHTSFGRLVDGREARVYSLRLPHGFGADISDFGGAIVRLFVPDRHGNPGDVALGFDAAAKYAAQNSYIGTLIGRVGNRIAAGSFVLDGKTYQLPVNNFPAGIPCCLHGGPGGFHQVLWSAEPIENADAPGLRLRYTSRDGEEGFPGTLTATVAFTLAAPGDLRLDYEAVADKPTPVNLTHHAYFNLRGEGDGKIEDHQMQIRASAFTPIDSGLIPTGRIAPVAGTPLDFQSTRRIGERLHDAHEQIVLGNGYDHNFVLGDGMAASPKVAAVVSDPDSGRRMEVLTTEPGVQFYSGNFLDGTLLGKSGRPYVKHGGFCLETQHFPDSPNQAAFPSVILRPGATLRSTTIYRFSAIS